MMCLSYIGCNNKFIVCEQKFNQYQATNEVNVLGEKQNKIKLSNGVRPIVNKVRNGKLV